MGDFIKIEKLKSLFKPNSIALVGQSGSMSKVYNLTITPLLYLLKSKLKQRYLGWSFRVLFVNSNILQEIFRRGKYIKGFSGDILLFGNFYNPFISIHFHVIACLDDLQRILF